jgi:hypothetical protein
LCGVSKPIGLTPRTRGVEGVEEQAAKEVVVAEDVEVVVLNVLLVVDRIVVDDVVAGWVDDVLTAVVVVARLVVVDKLVVVDNVVAVPHCIFSGLPVSRG